MVNNSTIINNMNNHLSPSIIEQKNTMTYGLGNLCPCLDQGQTYAVPDGKTN